jgi:hypothetical protein
MFNRPPAAKATIADQLEGVTKGRPARTKKKDQHATDARFASEDAQESPGFF